MRIATFFQPIKDSENLDLTTRITVPDQSLSVRDILMRFTRGQLEIPPLDEGVDDDIDATLNDFDDITDALDSIAFANKAMQSRNLKKSEGEPEVKEEVKRSETPTVTEDPPKD